MGNINNILRKPAIKIALLYTIASILWIIITDLLLFKLNIVNHYHYPVSILKGLIFTIGTGFLIFKLVERYINRIDSQRKISEHQYKEIEQLYRSLFENNIDGIISINLSGKILSANEVAEKLTGYSLAELEQKSIWKLVNKDSVEQVINHFEQAIKGNSLVTEIKGIRKNGRVMVLSIKDIPFIINGEIKGFFLIIRDITEKKKNEDYMRKSEKLSVIGELASSVAHEIRNPLTSIKGFLQLLRRDERIKDQFYIDIMLSEIDRINLIVSEFMILAKPHMTNYYVRDIKGLVVNVITLLQTIAIIKNIEIVTEFDDEAVNINCEENQIKQVFINILKNAIEAEKDGGKIKVKIKKDSKNKRVIVRFIDSGAGIPKERLPKLGEPFYTTKDKGTGLGLMVSFKIIQEHNGDIKIKSKEQRGTIVDISFPLAE